MSLELPKENFKICIMMWFDFRPLRFLWSLRMIFLHGAPPVFLEQQGFDETWHWLWLTSLTDESLLNFDSQNLQKSRKLTMSWIFGGTKLALEVGLILKRMCFGNSTRIFHCNNSFLKVNDLSFVIILCFSGNFFTTPLKTNITIAGKSTMNMDQMEIFQPVMSVFWGTNSSHLSGKMPILQKEINLLSSQSFFPQCFYYLKLTSWDVEKLVCFVPIASMYGIFACTYH